VLYVGRNYFFAMAPLVATFEQLHLEFKGRIYWETLPPGLLVKQIEAGGTVTSGNMTWTARPGVYLAGLKKVQGLVDQGMLAGPARLWRTAALAMLSVRVIQGFVYWGGGSRRFIYARSKLNPDAPTWMANKFQTAMPGALFGTDHLISFMLHHFWLLYAGVILFSAAELIVGAMLMAGALTRIAALVSMGFSVLLMAMFGWHVQPASTNGPWRLAISQCAQRWRSAAAAHIRSIAS
jgi:uncharacterized membrane protein YphA (DoxX/SURF4 family)